MISRKTNMICGLITILAAALLWSQAVSSEGAYVAEGIHPMDYPRTLIAILFSLGVILLLTPLKNTKKDPIPILSGRTVSMIAMLVLFAAVFKIMGFGLSAFVCASLCAYIMGWRNLKTLALTNAAGCFCIWALFTYALKIPLPPGMIW